MKKKKRRAPESPAVHPIAESLPRPTTQEPTVRNTARFWKLVGVIAALVVVVAAVTLAMVSHGGRPSSAQPPNPTNAPLIGMGSVPANATTNAGTNKTGLTDQAWCGPTNQQGTMLSSTPLPASTRRMAAELERVATAADPRQVPYINDRMVELLRKQLAATTNFQEQLSLRFQLGIQLMQAGQSEAGLQEYETIEKSVAARGGTLEPATRAELRMRKALALLRLGEQENCLLNHNAESCLIPVRPAAYHQLPRGSRGAITQLTEQLQAIPGDLSARWLLNLAYMTLGEYPDKVPAPWLIPPKCFASEYDLPRFPNVAGPLGLDVDDLAGGVILDDFDNDGYIDIVASAWSFRGQLRYFRNEGDGHFTERTQEAGLMGLFGGLNIQQTDYNNDGLLDIWILRGAWIQKSGRIPNSLLRNNGDGTFTDVTVEVGLLSYHPTQTSVWFDYDGDGWLDLFIGNETRDPNDPDPCELYHNNGNGTFTECAALCGLNVKRFVKGTACADYDHDGRPDLYLSCREEGENLLFHNDGPADSGNEKWKHWKFSEVTQRAHVSDNDLVSFPTWFFDYDNDGWEDLFASGYAIDNIGEVAADYLGMPHHGALPRLYHNNHDGTFTDVTVATHLNHILLAMGSNFGDLDNDGWLDFYVGTGDPDFMTLLPNRMFRNAEGKFFQDVTTAGGFGHIQKGHAIGFADLDGDGDQDIYEVMGGAFTGDNYRNSLYLNPGNKNHWVKLKLEGTKSNRAAIGARIQVNVETPNGPRRIFKTVNSGGSFGSSPLRQEIGLGNATSITSVEITWPTSGLLQKLTGIQLDQIYHIREGDEQAVAANVKPFEFNLKPVHQHAHRADTLRNN